MKKWMIALAVSVFVMACEKDSNKCTSESEKSFDLTGFTKVEAGGDFRLKIEKGNQFAILAKGCADDLEDLQLEIANLGTLEINYTRYDKNRGTTEIIISMPQLNSVILSGAAFAKVDGFAGQASVIRHVMSGVAECEVNGTGVNAQFELSGTSSLHISGFTQSLYGTISGNARLHGYGTEATEVDISASGTARAYVKPLQVIYAEASGESRVFYRGNPSGTHFSQSGNGKVIHD